MVAKIYGYNNFYVDKIYKLKNPNDELINQLIILKDIRPRLSNPFMHSSAVFDIYASILHLRNGCILEMFKCMVWFSFDDNNLSLNVFKL